MSDNEISKKQKKMKSVLSDFFNLELNLATKIANQI